ncbi:Uncharacterised protein [Yersinia mollaretii]|nr:Uncharacterised protein [Yersinia mollaretii]CQH02502.1 Uncharacterised protein [Yersinia mollaretii]
MHSLAAFPHLEIYWVFQSAVIFQVADVLAALAEINLILEVHNALGADDIRARLAVFQLGNILHGGGRDTGQRFFSQKCLMAGK